MTNRIIVDNSEYGRLRFYYVREGVAHYMFSQKFTSGVYRYFRYGVTEREVRRFRHWDRNPRLDKTIEKIPVWIRSLEKEAAAC